MPRGPSTLFAAVALAAAIVLVPGDAQADGETAGRVEVGRQTPDFTLPDLEGKDHILSAHRGEKDLLLVFFRGAWWPFCRGQLGELQEHLEAIRSIGAEVWAISPDEPDRLRSFRDDQGIAFPLLVDSGSETIRAYGILNEKHGEVPHPTVVIVDREGVVRFFHLDEDYKKRPPAESLVETLRQMGSGGGS